MTAVAGAPGTPIDAAEAEGPLLSRGIDGPHVDEFRSRVAAAIRELVVPHADAAERTRTFPRAALEGLGRTGLYAERWFGSGPHGDAGKAVVLAEELGYANVGGIGVGISLHLEAVTAILRRFGRSDELRDLTARAIGGDAVGCLATSEDEAGSELMGVATSATPDGAGGWRVQGAKRFVSPGRAADFALVLCRRGARDERGEQAPGRTPPLVLAVVPRSGFEPVRTLETSGMRSLETVSIAIDARVPDAAVLGRRGDALVLTTWGLTHERLAIAAQIIGGARLALGLATARLQRRRQFGKRLFDHQALRMRPGALASEVQVARLAVYASASTLVRVRPSAAREVAAIKATAARLGERVASECMHMFGGTGYLEDEAPLVRIARDIRVGRLGAGSDEMMWELVATGLEPDDEAYDRLVSER